VQSSLLISFLVIVFTGVTGCSTSAPALPVDYGSAYSTKTIDSSIFNSKDLEISCEDILVENVKLDEQRSDINKEIEESRTKDQAVVYLLGAATMLLGTNGDIEDQLNEIQQRLDTLYLLRRHKKC
jgi:hypothetical protein